MAANAPAAANLFSGKVILAPMVRAGTLPLRLLALEHGCDTVYSEELIDRSVAKLRRMPNGRLGTVDYIDPNGKLIFSTNRSKECGRLVFQMGSASASQALEVGHGRRRIAILC